MINNNQGMEQPIELKLSKGDIYNLNQFLNTVALTGKDAMVFAQLVTKINSQAQQNPTKMREVLENGE